MQETIISLVCSNSQPRLTPDLIIHVHLMCTVPKVYIGLVLKGQSLALSVLLPRRWPSCSQQDIWLLRPIETLDSGTAVKPHINRHTVTWMSGKRLLSSCLFPLSSCSINTTPSEKVGVDWLTKVRSRWPLERAEGDGLWACSKQSLLANSLTKPPFVIGLGQPARGPSCEK